MTISFKIAYLNDDKDPPLLLDLRTDQEPDDNDVIVSYESLLPEVFDVGDQEDFDFYLEDKEINHHFYSARDRVLENYRRDELTKEDMKFLKKRIYESLEQDLKDIEIYELNDFLDYQFKNSSADEELREIIGSMVYLLDKAKKDFILDWIAKFEPRNIKEPRIWKRIAQNNLKN